MFVDDGSRDGTHAALVRLHASAPNIRVVRLRRNVGKAAALDAGFREVEGDVVVTIDGDLQDDPAEIPRLLAKLDEGYDLVTGWKTHRNDPFARRVLSRIFNTVTGWLSGVRLHDMNCGLKAFRVDVARELDLYGELHRFIPVLAHDLGFRVTELGVNHRPREHGRSRYGMERYARGFLDLLTVTFMSRYRHRPLHLFGGLGLLLGTIGTGILVYLTIEKIAGEPIGKRPLLLLGVLLVVVGIQFLSLGLLSELRHEPAPRAAARARRPTVATRGRDPAVAGEGALLRDVRPLVPPQHAGRLVPAARGGDGGRAPPGGLGAPQLVARTRAARADGPRRGLARAAKGRRRRRRRGRLPRALRHARREADGARAAGRLQPPGLPPRHARRRSRVASGPARPPRGSFARWTTAPSGAPTSSSPTRRRTPRSSGGRSGCAEERVARRARGRRRAALPARVAPAGAVPRPLRREADPAPRPRDDPRRGSARARGADSGSSATASSPGCSIGGPRMSSTCRGFRTRSCRTPTVPPVARSASSGRATRGPA